MCVCKIQLLKNFVYRKIDLKFKKLVFKIFFVGYAMHIHTFYMSRT